MVVREGGATLMLLSDDEAVAIAAHEGVAWRTPLPTVSTHQPRELGAAVARGVRSLRLRGLFGDEGGAPELSGDLANFARGAQAPPGVMAQVVRLQPQPAPIGGAVLASGLAGDEVFVDLISALGVHEATILPQDTALDVLMEYLQRAFEVGPAGPGGPGDVEVWLSAAGAPERISVRRGAAAIGDAALGDDWLAVEARLRGVIAGGLADR